MATVRPSELPAAASVATSAAFVVDTGSAVEKATAAQIVDAAIPLASQAEAEAGANNAKRMTPLRVKQSIDALGLSAAKAAATGVGEGAELVGFKQSGTGTVARTVKSKLAEVRTFEDFGAVRYDSVPQTLAGTDSTAAIQAALDWAHTGGTTVRRINLTGYYLCGKINLHPGITVAGVGRQACGFVCPPGVTGCWIDTPVSAQKLCLYDFACYGNNDVGLTHVARIGQGSALQPEHGTEGNIRGMWFRDAPHGTALAYRGNVAYIYDCTLEDCKIGLDAGGNANRFYGMSFMQIGQDWILDGGAAADVACITGTGFTMFGCEIEAWGDGSVPLDLRGDCTIHDPIFSPGLATTSSHLIDVDTAGGAFPQFEVSGLEIINPSRLTLTSGLMKIDTKFYGGTDPEKARGVNYTRGLGLTGSQFTIKNQQMSPFNVRLATTAASVLQHRIGANGGSSIAGSFTSKIANTSVTLQNTPTGGAAFGTTGGSITASGNQFTLDVTDQVAADSILMANVVYNTTGTPITVWPYLATTTIGGVAKIRLVLEFRDHSGAAFNPASMGASKIIEVQVLAFLA